MLPTVGLSIVITVQAKSIIYSSLQHPFILLLLWYPITPAGWPHIISLEKPVP